VKGFVASALLGVGYLLVYMAVKNGGQFATDPVGALHDS
jgi:hypothetical protein